MLVFIYKDLGNNLPSGFVNYKKQNQGFGPISGDNNDIHEILATIKEEDIKDTFNYEGVNEEDSNFANLIENEILNTDLIIEEQDGALNINKETD